MSTSANQAVPPPAAPGAEQEAAQLAPRHWWNHELVRVAAAVAVLTVLVLRFGYDPTHPLLRVSFPAGAYLQLTGTNLDLVVAVLLLPVMRAVSYRKRDVLIIALVPFYGEYVAAKVVYRTLALPRRHWVPRPDELPRAVPIPGGGGAWTLRGSFPEAEALRTRWCRNPHHAHPYASWSAAPHRGCSDPGSMSTSSDRSTYDG